MPQQIKILIACHRPYPVPGEACYLPTEVGAALHVEPIPGFTPDNTGDNISQKNKSYCELTALYWAWKNLDAEAVGRTITWLPRKVRGGVRCYREHGLEYTIKRFGEKLREK